MCALCALCVRFALYALYVRFECALCALCALRVRCMCFAVLCLLSGYEWMCVDAEVDVCVQGSGCCPSWVCHLPV